MPFVDAVATSVIEHLLGRSTWTPPTTFHLGLSTTTPTAAGGNITEPGDTYARLEITEADLTAVSGSPPAVTNSAALLFPTPGVAWGDITHVVLYGDDAVIGFGELPAPLTVDGTDPAGFAAGAFAIEITNG